MRAIERCASAAYELGLIGSGVIGVQRLPTQARVRLSQRAAALTLPSTAQIVIVDLPAARQQRWYEALLLHEVLHLAQRDGQVLARAPLLCEATVSYLALLLLRQWRPRASWTSHATKTNHLLAYEETLGLPLLQATIEQQSPTGAGLSRWVTRLNAATCSDLNKLDSKLETGLSPSARRSLRAVQDQQRRDPQVRADHAQDNHELCAHTRIDTALGIFRSWLSPQDADQFVELLGTTIERPASRLKLPITLSEVVLGHSL